MSVSNSEHHEVVQPAQDPLTGSFVLPVTANTKSSGDALALIDMQILTTQDLLLQKREEVMQAKARVDVLLDQWRNSTWLKAVTQVSKTASWPVRLFYAIIAVLIGAQAKADVLKSAQSDFLSISRQTLEIAKTLAGLLVERAKIWPTHATPFNGSIPVKELQGISFLTPKPTESNAMEDPMVAFRKTSFVTK